MFPIYKAIKSSKKKKCFIYKKKDGSEKELDLKFRRSFLLFRYVNNHVPETSFPLAPIGFSDEQMRIIYKCVLYSYIAYKDRSLIEFPPEVNLEFEKLDSDVNRIPFYIVTDSTINAIVLSCRGSSCLDDFITDSLGNGVSYDGGKFHQGVFSTASYVFMQCQTKLIELNELLNKNSSSQENEDESSVDTQEIDYISSSEFDDSESESEKVSNDDDNSNEKPANQELKSSKKSKLFSAENLHSKCKSLFTPHIGHKSDSNEKLDSSDHNKSQKHSSTDNIPSSDSHDKSNIYKKMMKTPTKIIITGHSLGAAVAAVVTYLFKEKLPDLDVQCICFAPPPTLTFNLWKTTDTYIKSFMIEGDPVPFLSVRNIVAISDYLFKHEHTNKVFKKLIHKYLNKKSIEEYEANSTMEEPLYPPGELFLIKFINEEEDKTLIEKQKMHIQKKKEEIKKKFDELKQKTKLRKKKDDDDEDERYLEEEEGNVEVKDNQIQLCHVSNPEYFTNFVSNISENNHYIKNYTKLLVRILNKSTKKRSSSETNK